MNFNPPCPPPQGGCTCCYTGWPKTLFLTLSSADCPSLDGQIVELTPTNDNDQCNDILVNNPWAGQLTAGGCDFQVTVHMHTNSCVWLVTLADCVGVVIGYNISFPYCDWTSGSDTRKWNCTCCSNKNVTATLSL